jgi:hypothetical protein
LQLFYQLVNIIFVPGIPGAEFIPGVFTAARERIHRESSGQTTNDAESVQTRRRQGIPMMTRRK